MSNRKFDQFLSDVRNENLEDGVVAQAGGRVWSSISSSPASELSVHSMRSCEDFRALIPAYLKTSLPEGPPPAVRRPC